MNPQSTGIIFPFPAIAGILSWLLKRLFYHCGALGDFLTSLPALTAWRRQEPEQEIVYLGRPRHGELLKAAGLAAEVWDAEDARFLSALTSSSHPAELPARFADALVIGSRRSPLRENLVRSGCSVLWHPSFPAECFSVIDYHLKLVGAQRDLDLLEPLRRMALQTGSKLPDGRCEMGVVLAPGSGSVAKNWPVDRYEKLAEHLLEQGCTVYWCLGPAESGFPLPTGVRVLQSPPLIELSGTLKRAELYVGNDSGISHLAAMLGCRSLVLFGPSNAKQWAPWGEKVQLLVAPDGKMASIPMKSVIEMIGPMSDWTDRGGSVTASRLQHLE